jgi:hypothetical protein
MTSIYLEIVHIRYRELIRRIIQRILYLVAHLSEGIRTSNHKDTINILIEWINTMANYVAHIIVEDCIDMLYHLCNQSDTIQLKEHLILLTFVIAHNVRRVNEPWLLSSFVYQLHHIIDHFLTTQKDREIYLCSLILVDIYIQVNNRFE